MNFDFRIVVKNSKNEVLETMTVDSNSVLEAFRDLIRLSRYGERIVEEGIHFDVYLDNFEGFWDFVSE